jgi:hypothetical protein
MQLAATWPEGLDVDRLGWLTVAGIVVVVVAGLLVVRAAIRVIARLATLVLAGFVVVSLTAYRDELDDCRARCDCSLLGRRVPIPECDRDDAPETPDPLAPTTTAPPPAA